LVFNNTFLRKDGFDADGIAFGEEEADHVGVFGLQGGVFVMHDVPEILGEGVRCDGNQTSRSCLHQFARNTIIPTYNEKLLLTFDF
jgi:hypothetical protein